MKSARLTIALLAAALSSAPWLAQAQTPSGVLVRSDGIYVRCDQCGTVQSIEHTVGQARDHGTAGSIIGAVAGGVLGNQIGKGKGRTLATIGGAVGGGLAGHAIGTGGGSDSWTVRIKLGNGTYTNVIVPDASSLRPGDLVQVDANGNITRIQ
ncbi:glycine zipper 2TM domain-containing protein [Aerosticca soli]|uniref:Outer membrane lipoprotein n=1 Tax=Aerosticca soli TaxID=2010829 RepID=A0A2Z6E739_9GAMM|nr:glycine zipper 2TM domain-containing protein [Aerosticca soli]BBD80328.1 outer membrane lipoprotein [Aerosticca soli]